MKPIPPQIIASGPPGTEWFGGPVDRSTMALRVMSKQRGENVDKDEITRLLGREPDQPKLRHWSLRAPDNAKGDLDAQVAWLLSRVSPDADAWRKLTATYRVDVFCGLYLERQNRGVSLSAKTMTDLGARGIEIGLDIYAPDQHMRMRCRQGL